MNVRSQITLDPETQERARAKAEELGISFAEFARRAILGALDPPREKPDVSIFFDLGASEEPTNIARDKDKMIGQAVWEEYLRDMGRKPQRPAPVKKRRR